MFLEYLCKSKDIILTIIDFIESHSVLIGIITAIFTSSFWLRKFIKQKRAEAFFDFYSKLLLRIKSLKSQLEEYSQLNCSKELDGNIYSLIYIKEELPKICPKYKPPTEAELKIFKSSALDLKKCILESNSNVYPTKAKQREWYESQHIILSFCEFLEDDAFKYNYNDSNLDDGNQRHIIRCKELVGAMNYIINAIESEQY